MKHTFLYILVLLSLPVKAQQAALLDSIEAHNTSLRALRAQVDAEVWQNKAELRLSDPEAEVGYMFGTPKGVPNRVNVNVSQPLDWGVITGRKRKWAEAGNQVSQGNYRLQRQAVLSEAYLGLTQVVYYNRLCNELAERLRLAKEVQALYEKKFAQGDINQLEVNKVKLNASVAQADLQRAESERQTLLLDLQRMNGGLPLHCPDTLYASAPLPSLADLQQSVAAEHPQIAGGQAAIAQSEQQLKLSRSEAWPTFSVGFAGEYVKGTNYSGLTLGLSLPLWGNSRTKVRQSRAELVARKLDLADARTQLASSVQQQYASALALQQTADRLSSEIQVVSNAHLLRRSLDEGQISLLDYLLELSFYYDARTAQLEAERDARLAVAALRSYLL